MARTILLLIGAAASLCMACSNDNTDGGDGGAGEAGAAGSAGSAGSAASSGTGGSTSGGSGGSSAGSSSGGTSSGGSPNLPESTPSAMPLISRDVPAFASSGTPELANDGNTNTKWEPTSFPAWLAYDLSGVPEDERETVLVARYTATTQDYINPEPGAWQALPVDYTIEINSAAGGSPPADGWETVATVTGSDRNAAHHLVELDGANWVRMHVTRGTAPNSAVIDLDVHSAPDGPSDSWLFLGDSITAMTMRYNVSDLPTRVNDIDERRWPAIIPAGVGGTNTRSALENFDEILMGFPGRFVILAYGTNDHANEFVMEDLVVRLLAAGKIPAIPRMPWSDSGSVPTDGPLNNAQIEALYEKYPEIFHGPDLWGALEGRTDLIPSGDLHPTEAGMVAIRAAWAEAMTAD